MLSILKKAESNCNTSEFKTPLLNLSFFSLTPSAQQQVSQYIRDKNPDYPFSSQNIESMWNHATEESREMMLNIPPSTP